MNLEDIAKQAGVSKSTVSRVINNDGAVSKQTRARVMEIVDRLNFSPNHAARTLVTQRSNVIGVVVPGTAKVFFGDNSYFPMLLQGVADATNAHDHSMLLWLGQENEDREHFAQRILRNRLCDGLIIASINNDDPLLDKLIQSVPYFVMAERPLREDDRISYVSANNVDGGRIATQHLISLGYRRIAHITGNLSISDGQERLIGYRQALEQAGLPYDPDLVYPGQFDYAAGYAGMKTLLPHQPDALFAASDMAALGAMQVLEEAGLRVPHDIGIVGFDDLDVATKSVPPMTTIRQQVQQKGAAAVTLLIDMINGNTNQARQIILPIQLVIRESCGATLYQQKQAQEVKQR